MLWVHLHFKTTLWHEIKCQLSSPSSRSLRFSCLSIFLKFRGNKRLNIRTLQQCLFFNSLLRSNKKNKKIKTAVRLTLSWQRSLSYRNQQPHFRNEWNKNVLTKGLYMSLSCRNQQPHFRNEWNKNVLTKGLYIICTNWKFGISALISTLHILFSLSAFSRLSFLFDTFIVLNQWLDLHIVHRNYWRL